MSFGLGDAELADSLEVRWPSGAVQRAGELPAGELPAGHRVVVVEPG